MSVSLKPDNIPSLEGKVFLSPVATAGKQSILEFSKHGPKQTWLGARSQAKAQEAIDDIKAQIPNTPPIKCLHMDLGKFHSVRQSAKSFVQQSNRLDNLLLNAGIMADPAGTTEGGYEIKIGTNHMGHVLLTKLLLSTLLKTAEEPNSDVRATVLAAASRRFAPKEGVLFETLKTEASNLGTTNRCGQSKLANILFAKELARCYP